MALQKLNAQILEGGLTFDTDGNMTLTGNLYATDVGNDDDPIEDFYVSNDSIWIGDEHKLQVSSTGKMKFRKRKVTTVPAVIVAAGGDSAGALTHSGKASLSQLKKKHWRLYARSLGGSLANAKNKDIFRDNKADYQEESDASAWQVNDVGETYASVNVGIGNTNPATKLHITGTDALVLPVGNTSQRGTATQGGIRYSTELSTFEGYDGSNWGSLGGVIDVDQDTYVTAEATTDSDDLDFWTAGTKRMTIDQAGVVTITGTDALVLPAGTVAQRGTATQGGFRFNTETPGFEGYDGSAWGAIGGGASSELTTETTKELKGSYAETMVFSDIFILGGDLTLTDNLFLAKLGDDGNNITLTDDGTSRTITGQGTIVPGALFDSSFAIATAVQPNITQIGTTASIKVPTGTTAQRGTALAGGIRYNTTLASFEGYSGSAWGSLGGLIDVDQDTYITAELTADVDALDFYTDGTARMHIINDGAVAIGKAATSFNSTGVSLECIDGLKISSTTTSPIIYLDNQTTNGKKWIMKAESGDGAFTFKNATDNTTAYQINTSGQFLGLDVSGTITATGGTSSNWNTAYGWGDHSGAGYATSGGAITVSTINGTEIVSPATSNLGVGIDALDSITTGDYNTAVGDDASTTTTVGGSNSAFGYQALKNNISGGNNVAIGFKALFWNSGAHQNTAVGYLSLQNTSGSNNTGIGYYAGAAITSGTDNIVIGYSAGDNITTGDNNIIIGSNIDADSATNDNQLNIGGVIKGDLSTNAITLPGTITVSGGNSGNWNTAYGWGDHSGAGYATSGGAWTTTGNDIYYTTGNVGIGLTSGISEKLYVSGNISATGDITSSASDERLKENIEIIENAVDKIKTIDGIKFDWVSNIEEIGLKPKNKTEVGLIAQQLEKVLPEAVCPAPFDTPGTGISLSGEHYLTIRYEKVVPLLIEAIKEQQQQIDELKEKLSGI